MPGPPSHRRGGPTAAIWPLVDRWLGPVGAAVQCCSGTVTSLLMMARLLHSQSGLGIVLTSQMMSRCFFSRVLTIALPYCCSIASIASGRSLLVWSIRRPPGTANKVGSSRLPLTCHVENTSESVARHLKVPKGTGVSAGLPQLASPGQHNISPCFPALRVAASSRPFDAHGWQ